MKEKLKQIINQSHAEVNLINSDTGSLDYRFVESKHEEILAKASKVGEEEGLQNIPGGDVFSSDFERELITKYGSLYRTRISNEMSLVQQLKARYSSMLERLYNTNEGSILYRMSDIKTNFQKAKIDHDRPTGETNAIKFLLKHQWLIYTVLIALGIMELPLNNTVFKAFRLGPVPTMMAGILLVIAIPIMSHLCGKFYKRWKDGLSNKLWALFMTSVLASFSILISLFRFIFFQAQDLMREALEAGEEIPFTQIMSSVSYNNAFGNSEFLVALVFNVLLIGIGVVLGFLAHDSIDDFEKHYKNFHYERPTLIKRFNALIAKSNKSSQLTNGKSNSVTDMLDKILMITELHNSLIVHISNFGDFMNSLCHESINRYRSSNRRNRADQETVPAYWKSDSSQVMHVPVQQLEVIVQDDFSELV